MKTLRFWLVSLVAAVVGADVTLAASAANSDSKQSADREATKSASGDYVLQPSDLIRIRVYQEEELTQEVRLPQEMSVQLPLIGTVDLKGKTQRQAEALIHDLYDKDYLVNPHINVAILEYTKRKVTVLGSVTSPGSVAFPAEGGLNLLDAIAAVGGPTRLAAAKKVTLKRTNEDGTVKTITIDLDELTKGNKAGKEETYPLQPGDIIHVGERFL